MVMQQGTIVLNKRSIQEKIREEKRSEERRGFSTWYDMRQNKIKQIKMILHHAIQRRMKILYIDHHPDVDSLLLFIRSIDLLHITSYYFISYYIISYHIILYHVILHHIIFIISHHIMLHHIISYNVTLFLFFMSLPRSYSNT